GGAGSVAVGASVAQNEIGKGSGHWTKAYIDNSKVTSVGDVMLDAHSKAKSQALAIGGSGAGSGNSGKGLSLAFSGAGVATINSIEETVAATISGGSIITANPGAVALHARDSSEIKADAGGVAIAIAASKGGGAAVSGSIGIALAFNTIKNTANAGI